MTLEAAAAFSTGAAWWLVVSNVAFLLPAVVAAKDKSYREAVIFVRMAFVSGIYHIVDSFDHVHILFDYNVWQMLDFYCAFTLIPTACAMIVFPTTTYTPGTKVYRNITIKGCILVAAETTALALVLEDIATSWLVLVMAICCLVFIIGMLFIDRTALQMDYLDFGTSWFFILGGASLYFSCGSGSCYPAAHSLWHISMAAGLALLVESQDRMWNILNAVTCGKYCKPPSSSNGSGGPALPPSHSVLYT